GHSERSKASPDESLHGVYPERSRRVQGDNSGGPMLWCVVAPWLNLTMLQAVAKLRPPIGSEDVGTKARRKKEGAMAEQTIVFAQGIEMPPDILAQARQMKPAGFTLHMLPPNASVAEIAAAMRDAEY